MNFYRFNNYQSADNARNRLYEVQSHPRPGDLSWMQLRQEFQNLRRHEPDRIYFAAPLTPSRYVCPKGNARRSAQP